MQLLQPLQLLRNFLNDWEFNLALALLASILAFVALGATYQFSDEYKAKQATYAASAQAACNASVTSKWVKVAGDLRIHYCQRP